MTKFNDIIYKPLSLFKNKYTLRVVIYSCLSLFLILSLTNVLYSVKPELFVEYEYLYSILKDSIYQILTLSSLGYILSKYKFCYWSILSFYGIFYIKLTWFINRYIYKFPDYINTIDTLILIVFITMVVYFLTDNIKTNK